MSLFTQAAKKATTTTTKAKQEKTRISVEDENFFNMIQDLEVLNDRMKADKAKADMISNDVRDIARSKWASLYKATGKNPESVMVESRMKSDTAQVMLIIQDRYITIDPTRADELKEEYGDDIVETETTFSFDNDMIQKYGDVISRLISESSEISDVDKEKIVKASVKVSIAKGTIDKLTTYGDVEQVMEAVRPVVMLKTPEVIKG